MSQIVVGIADCQVSADPDAVLVTHALGSCIAVVVHDAVAKVGGMLHFMLPDSSIDADKARQRPFMFADTGIPQLFQAAYAAGAQKRRLSVRLAGGSQVMDSQGVFQIGKRNHTACRRILWSDGLMVSAETVGGAGSRTVRLQVGTGQVLWNAAGGETMELPPRGRS